MKIQTAVLALVLASTNAFAQWKPTVQPVSMPKPAAATVNAQKVVPVAFGSAIPAAHKSSAQAISMPKPYAHQDQPIVVIAHEVK